MITRNSVIDFAVRQAENGHTAGGTLPSADEATQTPQTDAGDADIMRLTKPQTHSFVTLLLGFAMLDRQNRQDKYAYIEQILDQLAIKKTHLHTAQQACTDGIDYHHLCGQQLSCLRDLTQAQKNHVLSILHDISLQNTYLHIEEKLFLDSVNQFWGLNVTFGKGHLPWTKDQDSIIKTPAPTRMIVNAPPGSGKTALICARLSHLIEQNTAPANIWLLSFTRAAIQEVRDRIIGFSGDEQKLAGIKIATLDARAWQIRSGLRDDNVAVLGGYDASITETIRLIDSKAEIADEYFESLEHIFIDEAQDITAIRKEFVDKILSLLPPSCGLSIFGDKAQAIYGFTNDSDDAVASQNFLQEIITQHRDEFDYRELQRIHRTDNSDLIHFIESLRLNIQIDDSDRVIPPEDVQARLKNSAMRFEDTMFRAAEFKEADNMLVLFRRRAEVLQALNFAAQNGIAFRLRMSGLPHMVRPWIGTVFTDYEGSYISKTGFLDLFEQKTQNQPHPIDYETGYSAYMRLSHSAGKGDWLDVEAIRKEVARTSPSIDLCLPDFGHKGPILGTIHASKGRQAEHVKMFLPPVHPHGTADMDSNKRAEESRILFVGASRARTNLDIGIGFGRYSQSLKNGRCFQKTGRGDAVQIEIGRQEDFDIMSVVHTQYVDSERASAIQDFLNNHTGICQVVAKPVQDDSYRYNLFAHKGQTDLWIGRLTHVCGRDILSAINILRTKQRQNMPLIIKNLWMVGVRTVSIAENHKSYDALIPSIQASRIWNVPVIMGYPRLSL